MERAPSIEAQMRGFQVNAGEAVDDVSVEETGPGVADVTDVTDEFVIVCLGVTSARGAATATEDATGLA